MDSLGRPTAIDRIITRQRQDGTTERITVADLVIERVRLGAPRHLAAASAGVSKASVFAWRARGAVVRGFIALAEANGETYELTDFDRKCLDFLDRLEAADGEFVMAGLGRIQQAAIGGVTSRKTTTTEVRDANGTLVSSTTTTVEDVDGISWTANAWLLERRFPEWFARRTELTGPGGGPVEVESHDRAAMLAQVLREAAEQANAIEVQGQVMPELERSEPGSFT